MSTPNDMEALLASIRGRPSPSGTPSQEGIPQRLSARQGQPYDGQAFPHPQAQHGYHHPSVSSNVHSPSPLNTPPHRGSDVLSPNVPTPRGDQSGRAADLLNLLKANQSAAPPQQESIRSPPAHEMGAEQGSTHGRNVSASDFVSMLFGKQGNGPAQMRSAQRSAEAGPAVSQSAAPDAGSTQDMLLRLLTRQQPQGQGQGEGQGSAPSAGASHIGEPSEKPMPGQEDLPAAPKGHMFSNYVNPFDQLAAASPGTKTPRSKSRSESPAADMIKTKVTTEEAPKIAKNTRQPLRSPPLAREQQQAVDQVVGQLVDQIGRDMDQVDLSAKEEIPAAQPAPAAPVKIEIKEKMPAKDTVKGRAASVRTETEQLADSWESAEDSAEKEEERVVPVYNFPLRPFITIDMKPNTGKLPSFRDDGIMDIARLKKDFDQLDRSLTSATAEYIVYTLAKSGIRIIRQDDGSDKQVFRNARDRMFSVSLCLDPTPGNSERQAVVGIGVSGAVYWAIIYQMDKDLFELDALDSESVIIPPYPATDENTSGGQLKTRAKRSSRHPAFIAIGRGKNIYVVSPSAAMDPAYGFSPSQRAINTEKFFKEKAFKISTGKAGKDFVFSEDDTVIASLDKTGRLRFWDTRSVVHDPFGFSSGEIRVPLGTLVTGTPTEKSWPTSVLFIDKQRAYVKSLALRYVLVGLKQNHTLQLWDIGLGKAVQELKFPHENESDAICSIAYHAASGIIVVAHPTRNSIYFVHLSAPRYNLPPMTQASFVRRASEKDTSLPRPESTACLSGIREISFSSKGQIRSFDLLPTSKAAGDKRGLEDENSLFELYVMHSKGVTCLNIRKEDLGWTADNKIIRPVSAMDEGAIEISDLQSYPAYMTEEPSIPGDSTPSTTKAVPKETAKKPEPVVEPSAPSPTKMSPKKKSEEESVISSEKTEKTDKKKKRKAAAAEGLKDIHTASAAEIPAIAEPLATPATAMSAAPTDATVVPGEAWAKRIEDLQNGVSSEFTKSLGREFEALYRRFDEERRNWDSASATKQDQVLRLVSSTLSDHVEKNLAHIISNSIQSEVLPAVTNATSAAVGKQLNGIVTQQVSRELRQALPEAVARAVQQPDVMRNLSGAVSQQVALDVKNAVVPLINNMSVQASQKHGPDVHLRMKQYEDQRQSDSAKIDQLSALTRGLSDTMASMAATQTRLQNEVVRLNRSLGSGQNEGRDTIPRPGPPSVAPHSEPKTPGDAELVEIAQLMHSGKFEEGSVKVRTPY